MQMASNQEPAETLQSQKLQLCGGLVTHLTVREPSENNAREGVLFCPHQKSLLQWGSPGNLSDFRTRQYMHETSTYSTYA